MDVKEVSQEGEETLDGENGVNWEKDSREGSDEAIREEGERVREVIDALLEDIGNEESPAHNTTADIGNGNTITVHLPPESGGNIPRKRSRITYPTTDQRKEGGRVKEVVPFYVKDRINNDLDEYDRFDLIIPFSGFGHYEPGLDEPEPEEPESEEKHTDAPVVEESCTEPAVAEEPERSDEVRWDEETSEVEEEIYRLYWGRSPGDEILDEEPEPEEDDDGEQEKEIDEREEKEEEEEGEEGEEEPEIEEEEGKGKEELPYLSTMGTEMVEDEDEMENVEEGVIADGFREVKITYIHEEGPGYEDFEKEVVAEEPGHADIKKEVVAEEPGHGDVEKEVVAEEPGHGDVEKEVVAEEPDEPMADDRSGRVEGTKVDSISLDMILESMLKDIDRGKKEPDAKPDAKPEVPDEKTEKEVVVGHITSKDHDNIVVNQCRSCGTPFCSNCAKQVKSLKGYGSISEEMFNENFEPLCLDCWDKFRQRLNQAKKEAEAEEKERKAKKQAAPELDESLLERGWERRQEAKIVKEKFRRRTPRGLDERLRERIDLLRKIRGLRWKVKKTEEMPGADMRESRAETRESMKDIPDPIKILVQESSAEVRMHRTRDEERYSIAVEEEEEEYDIPMGSGPESRIQNSVGMKFKLIPAGQFMMGSDRWEETQPVHRIVIGRPFYITTFPVTQGEWTRVMGSNPGYPKGEHLPVVGVTWNDCKTFLERLNEKERVYKYRLPSEAEWEYAARAGSTGKYCFGDDVSLLPLYGWFGEDWDSGQLHPVGLKRPNDWGLYDIHGNVWEWCADRWHDNYVAAPKDGRAWLTGAHKHRVRRGGTWANIPEQAETAYRNRNAPTYNYRYLGFRVIKEL